MAKRALLVGCNYPGSESPLKGCVNDVMRFREVLTTRFGFDDADIMTLVDTDENSIQPTHANIRAHLKALITGAQPGDVLLFQFSGHGLRMPPEAGESDETGWDEAILPCDENPLTDDDFRELVEQIPAGASFTFLSDSCHSGGLIDETKEQIGDAEDIHEQSLLESGGSNKEISVEQLTSMLSRRSGHPVEVGNIRTTLFDLFGDESSLTVKKFENLVMQQINSEQDEDGLVGTVNSLAVEFLQQKLAEDPENYLTSAQNAGVYRSRSLRTAAAAADVGILLSGCQSHEESADQRPADGEAYGAFTMAIETVLSQSEAPFTNREMILAVRGWLQSQGLAQHPCLYCSDDNADAPFICDYAEGAGTGKRDFLQGPDEEEEGEGADDEEEGEGAHDEEEEECGVRLRKSSDVVCQ